ncbi:MAG TPA: ATP-dependent RNA helicase [Chthoniobacterales bacterium]|nr:ATP-dependent RNA helicase [Chthoniobacterales bacterium]
MPREDLPIYELEHQLVAELKQQSRLILQAPTGSGKSTQVPQILLDHGLLGDGQVVILQPRRLATRLLAARVASERNGRLGDEVGYQIRFENITSNRTRIRFVTEGILLRQLIQDPRLRGVSAILFDEFHERHLYGDITLARANQLQATSRPDLKLAVMSATLDAGLLTKYLEPCAVLTSSGRAFPVDVEYLPKPVGGDGYPIWDLAADELERVGPRTEGDVLIFMPGKYEINRTISAVRASRVSDRFVVLPLHGELPPSEQDAALAHYEKRRAIVATNVAETSLTIDGVRVVIDSGLARIARFDPRRGINTLLIEKISRASAEQRAGRAGRTAPGYCLRLWTEREHLERAPQELPEVKRLDLAEVVLTLKASGVEEIGSFRWLESPDPQALSRAEQLLVDLGALGSARASRAVVGAPAGNSSETSPEVPAKAPEPTRETPALPGITPLGRRMLAFPVHPRYARMLLAAQQYRCVPAVALIAALTQGRNLLRRLESKQGREDRDDVLGSDAESDLFILMRAFRYAENSRFDPQRCARLGINAGAAREAAQLTEQFLAIARDEGLELETGEVKAGSIERCVLAGFPDQVAVRLDAGTLRCALVHGRRGVLARESAVHGARLLVASEVREIESSDKERQVLLTLATKIEEDWLRELFPESLRDETGIEFNPALRRLTGHRKILFHDLVLRSEEFSPKADPVAASILAREVLSGSCPLKHWDNAVEQWIARVNFVAAEFPDLEFPRIDEAGKLLLLEQICQGATSYKEIKERPVWPAVKSWLNAAQQQTLEELAPERIKLAKGRVAKITYGDSAPPTIAARIQDLYDTPRGLAVGRGRIALRIQVLAPNHRPIQITNDLESFWREGYPKIKKELQRKYPKHEWR